MKKKLFSLLLCLALILSVGVVAYAAAGGFTMTYLPGTADTVSNMPANDSGEGGQPYTVSDKIPQREGYEFLGWTLDYGVANTYTLTYQVTGDPTYGVPGDTATPDPVTGIRAGSNVTLANALSTAWVTGDGSPAPTTASYTVYYRHISIRDKYGDLIMLAEPKVVTGKAIGSTVTEKAIDIGGYTVVEAYTKSLTLKPDKEGKWTFTGWCSDEACTAPITEVTNISADTTVYGKWVYSETTHENEITFYYEEPVVQRVSYTVRYIDMYEELICPDVVREDVEPGTFVTECAQEIEGYTPLWDEISFEVEGDEMIVFQYYEMYEPVY